MEYNVPSQIVKELNFGQDAREKIMKGVDKLSMAVKSTLGASGRCVIYEDGLGKPVITKDGVTVAESVILLNPIENIGATLIKEAARNTVREAGDGTTTSTVLAQAILHKYYEALKETKISERQLKAEILEATDKVIEYIDSIKVDVTEDSIIDVASISSNNDKVLGAIITDVFKSVGKNGVVLIEESSTEKTYIEVVDGVQFDSPLKSPHLITDSDLGSCELVNPYVLIVSSPIPNIRKIQGVLEFVIKANRPLLIIGPVEQQPMATLAANKVKGNLKVNVVDQPGFGKMRDDVVSDLAILTGARVINEELGDDMDLITPEDLGMVDKSITDSKSTILTISSTSDDLTERIELVKEKIKNEENPFLKKKLEERMAMLAGKVGVLYVGANSLVELKEKKDRVDDAVSATKAALRDGIVPGGGVALKNASELLESTGLGYDILFDAIRVPFESILTNAGMDTSLDSGGVGLGFDVTTGNIVNMIEAGVIDPALVTKTALRNAVSVATTIISADCVISNIRA